MCTVSKLSEIYTHHNDSKKVRESNFFASWFHEIFFLWMSGEKRTEDCDESSDCEKPKKIMSIEEKISWKQFLLKINDEKFS